MQTQFILGQQVFSPIYATLSRCRSQTISPSTPYKTFQSSTFFFIGCKSELSSSHPSMLAPPNYRNLVVTLNVQQLCSSQTHLCATCNGFIILLASWNLQFIDSCLQKLVDLPCCLDVYFKMLAPSNHHLLGTLNHITPFVPIAIDATCNSFMIPSHLGSSES